MTRKRGSVGAGTGNSRREAGRRSGGLGQRIAREFWPLVVAGLLIPAAAPAGTMEGPLDGGRRRGAVNPEDFRLERVRFENDGQWLRMTIPIKAPWAHWTLGNPPRIIVDLGQTTSHLPNAPGLYQARIDRGPVRALRTSQFLYSPLDHRVRLTLDLSQVVPYEARRVGDEIEILIPDPHVRTPRAVVIGPTGIAGVGIDTAAPGEAPSVSSSFSQTSTASASFAAAGASSGFSTPGDATASSSFPSPAGSLASAGLMSPGFLPPSVTPHPDAIPPAAGDAPSPPVGERTAPVEGTPAGTDLPASTLREALAAFSGIGVEPVEDDVDDPPARPQVSKSARGSVASAGSGSTTRRTPSPAAPKPVAASPATAEPAAARSTYLPPARGHAELMAASSPGSNSVSPAQSAASLRTALPPEEEPQDPPTDSAPASDPKERSAARLLRQAVLATLRDDLKTAASTSERAYRFYAGTESGDQCGLLARELNLFLGRPADAAALLGLTARPDTTRLPRALYLLFVDHHRRAGDPAQVDRLLREWGPTYGPLPGLGALQYATGEAFLRAGDAEAAERHLRLVPAGDSLEIPALLLIAAVQDRRGQREAALQTYREVAARGPGPYQARGMARSADLEFQLGRVREALASYEHLLQSSPPNDEEVWGVYQAGNCHLLLGESTLARERYETVTKLWPRSFWAPFAKERLEEMTWRAQWANGIAAQ